MTTQRQSEKPARPSLTVKVLIAAGVLAQLAMASGGATAAPAANGERPAIRTSLRGAYRPDCAMSVPSADSPDTAKQDDGDRPVAQVRTFCRLAAAVAVSIRNNPAIF